MLLSIFCEGNPFIDLIIFLNWLVIRRLYNIYVAFHDGSGKESACQRRKHRRPRLDPGIGKILWRKTWQATPVFLPGKFYGQGAWRATVHGLKTWRWTIPSLVRQLQNASSDPGASQLPALPFSAGWLLFLFFPPQAKLRHIAMDIARVRRSE